MVISVDQLCKGLLAELPGILETFSASVLKNYVQAIIIGVEIGG